MLADDRWTQPRIEDRAAFLPIGSGATRQAWAGFRSKRGKRACRTRVVLASTVGAACSFALKFEVRPGNPGARVTAHPAVEVRPGNPGARVTAHPTFEVRPGNPGARVMGHQALADRRARSPRSQLRPPPRRHRRGCRAAPRAGAPARGRGGPGPFGRPGPRSCAHHSRVRRARPGCGEASVESMVWSGDCRLRGRVKRVRGAPPRPPRSNLSSDGWSMRVK